MELVALCVTLLVAVAMFAARIVLAKKQQQPTAIANSTPVAPQSSPASTTAGEPQIASVAVAAPRAERDASTAAVVAPPPVAPEQQEEPPLSSSPQGGKPSQQTDQEETGAAAATTPSGKVRKVKRVLKPRAKRDTEETSAAEMSDARRPAPAPRVTSRSRAAGEDAAPPPPQPPKPTAAPPLPPRVPVTPPPGVARPTTPTAAAPNGQAATHSHHQSRVSPQLRRTVSPYGITGMAVGRTTSPGGRIQPSASGNHSSNEGRGASASRPAPSSRPSSSPFRKVVAEGPSPAPAAPYTPPAVRNYQSDAAAVPSRRQYHSDAMPASRSAGRRAAEDSDYMSAPVLAMPVSRPKVKKATIAVAEARHKQHVAELTSLHEQFLRDAEAAKRDIQREREETARKAADLEADRQMFHARGSSPSTTAPASSTRVRVPPLEIGSVSPVTTNGGLESRRTEVPFQSNHGGSSAGGPLGYFSSQEGEQSDLSSRRVAAAPLQQGGAGAATPTLGRPRERTNSTYMMMDRIQQQPQDEMNNMAPPAVEKTLPRPEPKALVESVLQSPKKSSRSARHNAPSPVVVAVGRERNDSHHHAIEVGVTAGTVRTPPRAHPEQASPRQTHNNNKEEPQPKEAKEAKKSSREKMPHRREASEESNSGPVAVPTVGLRKERSDHRLHTPPPPLPPAATTAAAADSEEQTPLEATAPPPSMSKRPRDDEPVASTTTTAASPYRETYSCTVVFTGGPRPFYEKVRDVSTMERRQEHDEIMQGLHAAMLFDCSLSMNIPRDQLTLSPPIVITAPSKSQPSSAVNRSVKTVDEMIEEHDETLKAILEGKDPRYGDEEDANAVGGEEERSRLVTSVLHVKFDPTSVSSAELEERLRQGGLLFRATDRNPDPLSLLQAQNTGHYQPEEDGVSVFPVPAGHISATRQYMETLIASSIALSSPRPPLSPPRARAAAAAALQQQDNQGAPSNVETIDRTSPRTSSSSSSSATSSRSSTPTPNRNASSSVVVVPLQPTDLTFQSSCDQSNIRSPPAAADSPSKPLITKRRVSLRPPNALALEFGENGCERNDEDYRKRQRDAVTLRQILVLTACEESSSRAAIEVEEVGELALITNDEQNARRALQPVEQEEVPKATSPMSSTTRRKLALVQGMLLQNEDDLRNEIEDLEEDQRRALEESEETQRERYHRRRQAACIRQEERERDDLLREEMKVRTEELQTLNDDLYELLAAEEAAAIEAAEREAAEKAAQEAAERAAREAAERAAQEAAALAAKEAEEQAAKEAAERAAKEAADRAAREAAEREALEEEERVAREAHDADEASALRDAVDTEAAEREAAVAATLAREAAELAAAAAAAAEEEELPSSVSNDSSVSIVVADEQPDVEEEAAPQVLETDLQFLQEVQAGEEEGWDAPGSEKSPQRQLAAAASRPPKPFHYATFEASDMDHYPTAVLALRGMLRCSVRRGLDVSNVQAATTSLAASVRMFHFGDLCGLTEEKIKTPVPSEQVAAQDSEKQAAADDKGKKNKKKEKKQRKVEATTVDPQPQEGPSEADAQPTGDAQADKKKKKKGFFKSLVDKVDDMISSSSSSSSDEEEDRSSSSSSTSASSKSVKSDTAPQKSSSAKTKKRGEAKEATKKSSSSSTTSASSSSRSSSSSNSRSSSTSSTSSSSLSSPSSISTTTKETAKKEEEAELPSFARSNNCARFLTERSLFEDGDTLIEFNGHALHSHGHLRDLLAERAVAIRTAMLQEIEPDVNKWIGVGPDVLGGSVRGPGPRGITSTPPPPPEFENDAQREEWEAARNQRELEAAAEARRRLGMSAKLARLIAERFVAEVTVIRGGSDIEIVMLDS